MREDEPLEGWLMYANWGREMAKSRIQEGERTNRKALKQIAQVVDETDGKIDFQRMRGGYVSRYHGAGLAHKDTSEAERLYLEIWERGGPGSSYAGSGLLEGIALARNSASIPFWQKLLDLSKPRDRDANQRRIYAMAALALLAIVENNVQAEAAMTAALQHQHEQVRDLAIFYLVWVFTARQQAPGEDVLAALRTCAMDDKAFGPRFQARMGLRMLGHPMPLENEDHVYFFEVRLGKHPARRLIGIRAEQTLDDLHYGIQRAFKWDSDHLYSFFLSGKRGDERFEISPGQPDLGMLSFDLFVAPGIDDFELADEEDDEVIEADAGKILKFPAVVAQNQSPDGSPDEGDEDEYDDEDEDDDGYLTTAVARIGDLGLRLKHSLLYYFDYGDSHEFSVKLTAIEPRRDDGPYPRVFEATGEAPQQYPDSAGW